MLRTKILRTDNGTEFINSEVHALLAQTGIVHERTCPDTSHQNAVAERAIGRLMPMVRTHNDGSGVSATRIVWGSSSGRSVAHVLNRMPCSSNTDSASPFQIRYGRVPQISHF